MAEEQKTVVDTPKEEVAAGTTDAPALIEVVPPPTETPAIDAAPVSETPADTATDAPVAETPAPETEAAKEEDKEELKTIEEGVLEHKKAAGFPKNLISTKHTFWFGTSSVEKEVLATYLKSEKTAEVAFHNAAWATKTGAGLLFYGEKKDTIAGIINLADSEEPTADGNNKFHFTTKGVKHTFKAPTKLDRDSWVAQLKTKIAEAKESAPSVTDSEEYKSALETLKTKPAKKEDKVDDKPAEALKEEGAAKEEDKPAESAPAVDAAAETPKADEPVIAAAAAAADGKTLEEPKDKDGKRRSSSRKRFSVFGLNKGKKEEKKEEPAPVEGAPAVETSAAETPAAEVTAETAAVEAAPAPGVDAPATEDKPAEEKKEETAPVKPTPTKRTSVFSGFFTRTKSSGASPTTDAAPVAEESADPAKETVEPTAPVAETAPVIPPVDTGAVVEAAPAPGVDAPVTEESATPAAPTEKQEVKAEKRKSSLPLFGKKDKTPTEEVGDKSEKKPTFFSTIRNTIKHKAPKPKSEEKSEDKTEEKLVEDKKAEETPAETAEAAASTSEAAPIEPVSPVVEEEAKPAPPAATAPVTAAA